jgi:REP element-mobilizing transposase RayT
MGRTHRKDYPYAYHHVMNRAGAKRWVFLRDEHRHAFLESLQHVVKVDNIEVHAFCLMGNHFHLLMRSPKSNLSQAMQHLSSIFTRKFNRIEKIDGALFRGRFKSIVVGHDEYLRVLCRYIRRNPVAAGLVKHPSDYVWSSYQFYAGKREPPSWLNYQTLPTYFPGPDHLLNLRTFVEADDHPWDEINDDNPISDGTMMLQPPNKITYEAHLTPPSLQIVLKEVAEYFVIDSNELLLFRGSIPSIPREL